MPDEISKVDGLRLSDEELARVGLSLLREAFSSDTRVGYVSVEDVNINTVKVIETLSYFFESPFTVRNPRVEEFITHFQHHDLKGTAVWLYEKITNTKLPDRFYEHYFGSDLLLWSVEHAGQYLSNGCHSRKSRRYEGVFGVLIEKLEQMLLKNIKYMFGLETLEEIKEAISTPPKLRRQEACRVDHGYYSHLEATVVELLDLRESNINRASTLEREFFDYVVRDPYIVFLAKSSIPVLYTAEMVDDNSVDVDGVTLSYLPVCKPRI